MLELWRCIPSCVVDGEVLCYTVREIEPGVFEYAKRWEPAERWFAPDGSYCATREA